MSNTLANKQKAKKETFVVILGIVSIISLVLASILNLVPAVEIAIALNSIHFSLLSYFIDSINWFLVGVLLPVSLLLLCTSSKKKSLSILFIIVSILFISIQFLSAIVGLVDGLTGIVPDNLTYIFAQVSAKGFLWRVWLETEAILQGSLRSSTIIRNLSCGLSEILYVLPNLLCLVGFIKLIFTKKPVTQETENINNLPNDVQNDEIANEKHIVKETPKQTPVKQEPLNGIDEIKQYKELLDQGILTQEEFDTKKKQLLDL